MSVTLQWDANTETDLAGYRVYYGTSPRTYQQPNGHGVNVSLLADENPNPALVQFTLRGLPDVLTYFAVTAYDNEVPSLESDYSNEVSTDMVIQAPHGMRLLVK